MSWVSSRGMPVLPCHWSTLIRPARPFLLPVSLLLIWQLVQAYQLVPVNLLPTPLSVLETVGSLAISGELTVHLAITSWRVLQGFLLGSLIATLLGSLTGMSSTLRDIVDPLLQGLRSIPSLAWVPLFILWLGIYESSKVALIATGAFFPVYLSLTQGLLDVDRKLVEVGRMAGFDRLELVRRILIPASLPSYVTGLRGGLGLAWMFVVAAEVMGASRGLGFLLLDGQQTGRASLILGSIFMFALLGKLSDLILVQLTRPWLHWQDSHILQPA